MRFEWTLDGLAMIRDTIDHDSDFQILSILFIHVRSFDELVLQIYQETHIDSGRSGDRAALGSIHV